MSSNHLPGMHLGMSLSLLQGKTIQQPAQFPVGNHMRGGAFGFRPSKGSLLQAAVVEPKAGVIPLQDFELIALSVTEDKLRRGERIQLKMLLHDSGQAVDGFAQIGDPAGEINLWCWTEA
jgi:hypothetical protein